MYRFLEGFKGPLHQLFGRSMQTPRLSSEVDRCDVSVPLSGSSPLKIGLVETGLGPCNR